MLFDLKGKRKRLVQVVYLGLAILFGGGLVLFGAGSNVSGGLIDAFTGNGGGSSTQRLPATRSNARERRRRAQPARPEQALARRRARRSSTSRPRPTGSDAQTGAAHRQGRAGGLEAVAGLGALPEAEAEEARSERGAVRRARLRRAAGLRQGGQDPGDRARRRGRARTATSSSPTSPIARATWRRATRRPQEAVRRTPTDQRNTVRALIKDAKKQGAQIAKAVAGAEEGEQAGRARASRAAPPSARCPAPGSGRPAGAAPPSAERLRRYL